MTSPDFDPVGVANGRHAGAGRRMTDEATVVPGDGATPEISTVDKAYEALATAIRRGDYAPNQRLIENELTERLGTSRVTLRAVFLRLHQEDYIVVERNKGARVRAFGVADAIEILQTREILEGAAAGLAAERITPEQLDELGEVLEEMKLASTAQQASAYSGLNRRFHQLVLAAANQPTLAKFINVTPYPLVMRQFRDPGAVHPRAGSLEEHTAIYAALRVRSAVAAEATMKFHVSSARHALTLRNQERPPIEGT
jgi:DNA-binding GntR family transcriptional regulator